jgi:hypothetical protein
MLSSLLLYIIGSYLIIRRNKSGIYIFISATVLILLLGIIKSETSFFAIAGIIGVTTFILMNTKFHGKNVFQILK